MQCASVKKLNDFVSIQCRRDAKYLVEYHDGSNLCLCGVCARRNDGQLAKHPLPKDCLQSNAVMSGGPKGPSDSNT